MLCSRTKWLSLVLRFSFVAAALITTAAALYPNFKLSTLLGGVQIQDPIVHLAAFAVITVIAAGAWQLNASIIVPLVLFALALELAQYFAPGREVSLTDAAFSLGGVMMGSLVFVMSAYFRRNLLGWT